eukprot:1703386-Pyramimonas_sp.AAC.1
MPLARGSLGGSPCPPCRDRPGVMSCCSELRTGGLTTSPILGKLLFIPYLRRFRRWGCCKWSPTDKYRSI